MKKLISIFICTFAQVVFAQFAIITDKDGFANIRKSANLSSEVVNKLANGEVVYCFEPENDWFPIDYHLGEGSQSGYIHKSRIKFLNSFQEVVGIKLNESSMVFKNETLKLSITQVKFVAKNYKLQFHNGTSAQTPGNYLEKINGKRYWGTDGNLPRSQYGQCMLQLGNQKIALPIDNLFEPSLESTSVHIDKASKKIYIWSANGDAAGAYMVLWIIENGKFKERVVTVPF